MAVTFNEATKALFDGKNFPVVATINADGSVQTSVVWAKRDGDAVVFSTLRGRLKERNLSRDPRISLSVFDMNDPLSYVEVRGRAEITEEGGRELIDELAKKYTGENFRAEPPEAVRVVVRVVTDKITGYAA